MLKEKIDNYTHKWNLFVRSGEEKQYFDKLVQKVVFNLHETFQNPIRVCKSTPFCVKENGYGEFELPIDIYFNGTNEKYTINYFLELQPLTDTKPLSNLRKEIITFINPCAEFRKILIEGGASIHTIPKPADATNSSNGNAFSNKNNKPLSIKALTLTSSSTLLNSSLSSSFLSTSAAIVNSKPAKKHSLTSSTSSSSLLTPSAVKPQKLINTNNGHANGSSNSSSLTASKFNKHLSSSVLGSNTAVNEKKALNNKKVIQFIFLHFVLFFLILSRWFNITLHISFIPPFFKV